MCLFLCLQLAFIHFSILKRCKYVCYMPSLNHIWRTPSIFPFRIKFVFLNFGSVHPKRGPCSPVAWKSLNLFIWTVGEGSLEPCSWLRSFLTHRSCTPVSDRIKRGRNAVFGLVARLPDDTRGHQAILRHSSCQLMVDLLILPGVTCGGVNLVDRRMQVDAISFKGASVI